MKKFLPSLLIAALAVLGILPALTFAEEAANSAPPPAAESAATPLQPAAEPPVPDLAAVDNPNASEPEAVAQEIPLAEAQAPAPEPVLDPPPGAQALSDQTTGTPAGEIEPAASDGTAPGNAGTTFTQVNSPAPDTVYQAVKAVWEMEGLASALTGTDNGSDPGAQFLPSGKHQVSKPVSVCAAVSNFGGADMALVAADISYPRSSFDSEANGGRVECGDVKVAKQSLTKLSKEDGLKLFCDAIRAQNPHLPQFSNFVDFEGLCGGEGELQTPTAAVYCGDIELSYNDPPGDYQVAVVAENQAGQKSLSASNVFDYLELTAFEMDFSSLNYASVEQGLMKAIEGDAEWQESKGENHSTVRNVGNTRLQIGITQDDMGLGKSGGEWNIRYGTKLGAGAGAAWVNYWPEERVWFDTILDSGKMDPIGFAIAVLHFPQDDIQNYSGRMTLSARKAEPLLCK